MLNKIGGVVVDEKTVAKLDELKSIRKGMSWGGREHGIPQLSDNEVFLLNVVEAFQRELEEIKKTQY